MNSALVPASGTDARSCITVRFDCGNKAESWEGGAVGLFLLMKYMVKNGTVLLIKQKESIPDCTVWLFCKTKTIT